MRFRPAFLALVLGLSLFGTIHAFQREWREVPALEYGNFPIPPDYREKGEWVFARMIYPVMVNACGYRWRCPDNYFTMDYPRSDRHFSAALRRLTRVATRSVEQVVDPLDRQYPDDIYNYPWMYAVEVGHWNLSDEQCKKMREYFDRGGFLMVDDFHGTQEWATFTDGMNRIFPDRQIVISADSAYGGKTAVDLPAGKNYVGAYHQPAGVVVVGHQLADAAQTPVRRAALRETDGP